jgi:hypothetical protein
MATFTLRINRCTIQHTNQTSVATLLTMYLKHFHGIQAYRFLLFFDFLKCHHLSLFFSSCLPMDLSLEQRIAIDKWFYVA